MKISDTQKNHCGGCRYYLPSGKTFYNKPCGYCANSRTQTPRIATDKPCELFEPDNSPQKPP